MALEKYKTQFVDSNSFVESTESIIQARKVVIAEELELTDGRVFSRDYIPLFNDDEPAGHLWAYSDITLQKNYRRNIEQQKEKYSSIIANMNLGLVEVDNDGEILMVNHRYCEMIGLDEEELVGQKVLEVMQLEEESLALIIGQFEKRKKAYSDSYQVQLTNHEGKKKILADQWRPNF